MHHKAFFSVIASFAAIILSSFSAQAQGPDLDFLNHNQPILDAHNCYPYQGHWSDRIQRALRSGFPVSIEQDLAWYVDPATGVGRVVVSHTPHPTGSEPTLEDYFFKQVRPVVEKAAAENKRDQWPVIVLHFDFKDNQPALLKESDEQQKIFYDDLRVGERLRLFGSAHTHPIPKGMPMKELIHWAAIVTPEELLSEPPTNYRRWWNSSWYAVEEGGEPHAGDWTAADNQRLRALVDHAHKMGYWVRFYTLDGFAPADDQGWGPGYNFGSPEAVIPRWKAAIAAGVNFIATNQYETLATYLDQNAKELRATADTSSGK
jgi:hypothetical protein